MVIKATQELNINLDNEQQKEVTRDYLYKQTDWKPTYFVNEEDGWVYEEKTCHTTHSFEVTDKVRLANSEDILIDKILKIHMFNL